MKRIVRLNAVENICPEGILGMNQHSLHPEESLSPQKLTISGVNFASPILAFINTLNRNNGNSLFVLKTALRNIQSLNILLLGLLNKSSEVVSFLLLSASIALAITFGMGGTREKIEQVNCSSREPQLGLVKARNCIKSEFVLQKARQPIKPPSQIWETMSPSVVKNNWKAKNIFPFLVKMVLLFAKRGMTATSYFLIAISQLYPAILGCLNTRNKTAFYEKLTLLLMNLSLPRLLTIFNQQDKVQTLIAPLSDRDYKFMCRKVVST